MKRTTSEVARTHAFILAGGQGERLHPLTVSRPKPAVSFGGVFRIIDFTLLNCLYSGLTPVFVITQYLQEEIHRYIEQSWNERWRLNGYPSWRATCLPPEPGRRYSGTADAVLQNLDVIGSEDKDIVLVLSGDHIYQMDYLGFIRQHADSGADLTLATVEFPVTDASHFGVVQIDESQRVVRFDEKPERPQPIEERPSMTRVSMGVYAFSRRALERALKETCADGASCDFGKHVIPKMIKAGHTYAYDFRDEARNVPHYWRDIGTLDGYYAASMDFAIRRQDFVFAQHGTPPALPARTLIPENNTSPARIVRSVVAPDVFIGEEASVEDCVLMPGVRIGKRARLRRAIVEEGTCLPDNFQAGFDLETDRRHHVVTFSGIVIVRKPAPAIVPFATREKAVGSPKTLNPLNKTSAAAP